jgi:predicted RNA-binding Zn-ribbon protein involved in translation (DUF1610 family)
MRAEELPNLTQIESSREFLSVDEMSIWDSEKLWMKAKIFIDRANEHDHSSTDFAFWTALSLECLARSALTSIHPVLNADPRDDENLLYGVGYQITAKPRSLPAHSVYLRLEKTVKKFGKQQRELCEFVALLRNAHLHTAELPYENLMPAKWLPRFYETVMVLNEFLGKEMSDFLGPEIANSALQLIGALNAKIVGSVKSKIAAHAKVFTSKSNQEQEELLLAAKAAKVILGAGEASRQCPACGGDGTLTGSKVKEFAEEYVDGELQMEVQYLASGFNCPSCGLALKGVEEIVHAGLDTHFLKTTSTSLHDLYEPEYYQEYDNM